MAATFKPLQHYNVVMLVFLESEFLGENTLVGVALKIVQSGLDGGRNNGGLAYPAVAAPE